MFELPKRSSKGNKGTFGTVAVFGGSMTDKVMLGGPVFAAEAALRAGVGLVVFLGKKELLVPLIEMMPQAAGEVFVDKLPKETKKWKSIVIGPGLGVSEDNIKRICQLLRLNMPTVIDADGLNTLTAYPEIARDIHSSCVLTPHVKEFERLAATFNIKDPESLAKKLGCTLVIKDSTTRVCTGNKAWTYENPNPALATGGTGDVLAGLIGGLLAQYYDKLSVFDSACLAVEIHGQSAETWRSKHGSGGLLIHELLAEVPAIMDEMRAS